MNPSQTPLEQLRAKLREESGTDAIRSEAWVVAQYVPAGLVAQLLAHGTFTSMAKRHLSPPVHEKAWELVMAGVGDWWLGLAYGVVDGEWCWFVHSWLTATDAQEAIELTTSTPKKYFGLRVTEITPALRAALASDPPDR